MTEQCSQLCAQAEKWLHQLLRSQQGMRLLAGHQPEQELGEAGELPDSASVAGSTDASQASQTTSSMAQAKLSVSAKLGEVALFVSGRSADVWWPAEVRCSVLWKSLPRALPN